MTLKGIDISNYQRNINYSQYDFYIIKASEGRTFKDPMLDSHYNGVKKTGKLYGFYHYARPENNGWKAEADHFLNLVGHHAGKAIFALDWEGNALKYNATWALNWLNYVYQRTGVKPLFYTSDSQTARYAAVAKADYGLWDAKYSSRGPAHKGWSNIAIWQYSGSPLDKDIFYGDASTWMKYAAKNGKASATPKAAKTAAKVSTKATVKSTTTYTIAYLQNEINRQFNAGLKVDGISGPKTLKACPTVKFGAKGNITKWIQSHVGTKVDGAFGNNTKNAVISFQRSKGLSADGVVGQNTWRKLLGL